MKTSTSPRYLLREPRLLRATAVALSKSPSLQVSPSPGLKASPSPSLTVSDSAPASPPLDLGSEPLNPAEQSGIPNPNSETKEPGISNLLHFPPNKRPRVGKVAKLPDDLR